MGLHFLPPFLPLPPFFDFVAPTIRLESSSAVGCKNDSDVVPANPHFSWEDRLKMKVSELSDELFGKRGLNRFIPRVPLSSGILMGWNIDGAANIDIGEERYSDTDLVSGTLQNHLGSFAPTSGAAFPIRGATLAY